MMNLTTFSLSFVWATSLMLTSGIPFGGNTDVFWDARALGKRIECSEVLAHSRPHEDEIFTNQRSLEEMLTSKCAKWNQGDSFDLSGNQTHLAPEKGSIIEFIFQSICREQSGCVCVREFGMKSLCVDQWGSTFSHCTNSYVLVDDPVFLTPPDPMFWLSCSSSILFFLLLAIILYLMYVSFLSIGNPLSWHTSERADLGNLPASDMKTLPQRPIGIGGDLLLDLDIPLGEGKHSKVYRGTYCHKAVAVKVSHKVGSFRDAAREPAEVKHLKLLQHPHIVAPVMSGTHMPKQMRSKFSHAMGWQQSGTPYETFIVVEYCDRGNLHQTIKQQAVSKSLGLEQITLCGLEIAQAMAHMHSKRIVHGALHTKHILLQSHPDNPKGFICKVGGLGSSLRLCPGSSSIHSHRMSSISIAAPEVLKSGTLSYASDVYAYGVLLYKLCVNQSLFHELKTGEIRRQPSQERSPERIASHLRRLIKKCLSPCVHERPTFLTIAEKLEKIVAYQHKQAFSEFQSRNVHHSPSSSADSSDPSPFENLVPGKTYACINFRPCTRPKRRSPTMPCLDLSATKDRRQATSRRTKSCITSYGKKSYLQDAHHEAFLRQVDELIKRSKKSESKDELKQFLKTLAVY